MLKMAAAALGTKGPLPERGLKMERQHQTNTRPFSFEGETAGALANLLAGSEKLRAGVRSRSPLTEANKPESAVLSEAGCKASRLALLDPTRTGGQAANPESTLCRVVIGQDEAIREIVRAYQTPLAGLCPIGRPIGNFLFLRPTGSGKTSSVEATAEALLGSPRAVERVLVQLPSNLMATSQIHTDDRIRITHRSGSPSLTCFREAGSLEEWDADGVTVVAKYIGVQDETSTLNPL